LHLCLYQFTRGQNKATSKEQRLSSAFSAKLLIMLQTQLLLENLLRAFFSTLTQSYSLILFSPVICESKLSECFREFSMFLTHWTVDSLSRNRDIYISRLDLSLAKIVSNHETNDSHHYHNFPFVCDLCSIRLLGNFLFRKSLTQQ